MVGEGDGISDTRRVLLLLVLPKLFVDADRPKVDWRFRHSCGRCAKRLSRLPNRRARSESTREKRIVSSGADWRAN